MELVLSPGYIEDNDGSPFHNEDVHEWSHVDRLTGMLENARIETGRWQAKNQGSAQSYGKVIDSRERNSADGNMVQRAQRKVEVFQSQEVGGKSIQVVRASQWSSSRVSDLIRSSPLKKLSTEHHVSELESGLKSRLNDWSLSKDSLMQDPLSSLCRKLHSEVINNSHSLPLFGQSSAFLTDQKLSKTFDVIDRNKYSTSTINEKKSNSNEDFASLIEEEDSKASLNFARDYRVRRSLQLSDKKNPKDPNYSVGVKLSDMNSKLSDLNRSKLPELKSSEIRLRAKAHLEDNSGKDSYSSPESSPRNAYIGRNSSITRSRSPGTGISSKANLATNPKPLTYFCQDPLEKNRESLVEIQKPTSIRLCAQETSRPVASNKTIVHLGKPKEESTGLIKVITDLKNTPENQVTNSQESNILFLSDCSAKPTKKVLFCKTEVHFVADSGKVNIVETDGKPPPTNRFRRRRRNSNSNINNSSSSLGISANKNLPVVHFGDTSYEKYIFGASKKRVSEETQAMRNPTHLREEEDYKDWLLKSNFTLENDSDLKKDFSIENDQINTHDKIVDQRHKGHTTTVNFGADGFCNLRSIVRDDTSKLSNVEEVSLEAHKIISALDLVTRKNDHKIEKLNIKPRPLETDRSEEIISGENQILIKPVAIHRPVIARIDFDHSPKLINKFIKRPSTISSLYPGDKIDDGEMISPRLVKSNEMEKISSRFAKSNEVDKISSRLAKSNEVEKISPRLTKSNEIEKISSRLAKPSEIEKISSRLLKSNEIEQGCLESAVPLTHEAKDFCDVSSGAKEEICDPSIFTPIYANVFDSVRKDVPIYENFHVKSNSDGELGSKKIKGNEESEAKVESSKSEPEEVPKKIQTQVKQNSLLGRTSSGSKNKSAAESNKNPPMRRSKKDVVVSKEKKIEDLDKIKRVSNKSSSEISDLREKVKNAEDEKGKSSKTSLVKRDLKRNGSKSRNSKQDLGIEISAKVEATDSTKTKKPVEVVYKTAVYNMKNEKLSKPTKAKESKGPRYINDIICGSKERKPSADKHTKMNATSQQKSTKGTSLTSRN